MKHIAKNMLGCKECNASGRYLWGHNMGEPIYKPCEDCNGSGYIVKGWKKK